MRELQSVQLVCYYTGNLAARSQYGISQYAHQSDAAPAEHYFGSALCENGTQLGGCCLKPGLISLVGTTKYCY
jgi:hypothetical protein